MSQTEAERCLKAIRKTVEIKREVVVDKQQQEKNPSEINPYKAMFDMRTVMKRLSPEEPDCPA